MADGLRWWQRGVIYQVYPRSFQDSDGDGVGDLAGISTRLDYLQWLGVDAVWVSPIYPSPMADFGYDVSDYTGIEPVFGTMADFDALLADVHARGMKLLLDFVPNHTSDRHPWFLEARSSRTSPKRDWYIWKDPRTDGSPPNNWLSIFGGRAWTLDEATGQFYYHTFLKEQPELNWRNPAVREAMYAAMRFWLDRGVDGFRIDVLHRVMKDDQFRDNPVDPTYREGMSPHKQFLMTYNCDLPDVHRVVAEMRKVIDAYPDRMLVGEIYLPVERLVLYYGEAGSGIHLPFNFQLIGTAWDARTVAEVVDRYEAALPPYGWPNWVLSNHDRPRVASRVGPAQARVAAMLLFTLRGTPTLYYGDELGMHDVPIPPARVQDPYEKNVPGLGLGRDPCRTPMQWDASPNAGFTSGEPWLPLADDHATANVAAQREDPRSMLALHRTLLALRRADPALLTGAYARHAAPDGVFAFTRTGGGRRLLVALNFTATETAVELPWGGRVLLSTHLDRAGAEPGPRLALRGDEGVVVELPAG